MTQRRSNLSYIDTLMCLSEIQGVPYAAALLGRKLGREEAERLENRARTLGGSPLNLRTTIAKIRAQAEE